LLAQCYRFAQMNGETTPVEQNIIQAIATKFGLDVNSIQSSVNTSTDVVNNK
jgi:hypothetical protein